MNGTYNSDMQFKRMKFMFKYISQRPSSLWDWIQTQHKPDQEKVLTEDVWMMNFIERVIYLTAQSELYKHRKSFLLSFYSADLHPSNV